MEAEIKRAVKFLFQNTFLWQHLVKWNRALEDYRSLQFFKEIYRDPNKKEIRVAGLKRTGNHAIISWINPQHPGDLVFMNNVVAGENPVNTLQKERFINFPNQPNRQNCVVYSYEDYRLHEIFNEDFEKKHDSFLGKSKERFDVVILRDPYNFFASRHKWKGDNLSDEQRKKEVIDLWKMYAKEYLGETNYLKHNKTVINYNQWFLNKNYREEIAAKLRLIFTDEGINVVRDYGMGSSFDGTDFHGNVEQMKVLERWKSLKDDEVYKSIFHDKELVELSERIFGKIHETELLLLA